MKTRIVLCVIGMLMVVAVQARHPQFTRLATPSDPTFDIVISCWRNPDETDRSKMENIISNLTDVVYECTEGVHRLRNVRIYTNGKMKDPCDLGKHADDADFLNSRRFALA